MKLVCPTSQTQQFNLERLSARRPSISRDSELAGHRIQFNSRLGHQFGGPDFPLLCPQRRVPLSNKYYTNVQQRVFNECRGVGNSQGGLLIVDLVGNKGIEVRHTWMHTDGQARKSLFALRFESKRHEIR